MSLDQELICYIVHSYILLTKFSSLVPIIIIFVLGFKFKALRRTSSLGLLPDQERNSNQTQTQTGRGRSRGGVTGLGYHSG